MTAVPWILLGVFGLLFLVVKTPLGAALDRLVSGGEARRMQDPVYALLRREVEKIGRELEALPYDDLLQAEERSTTRVVDGVEITFSTEIFHAAKNGDIGFCVDAHATPRRTHVQPTYQFFKRIDGSVYH